MKILLIPLMEGQVPAPVQNSIVLQFCSVMGGNMIQDHLVANKIVQEVKISVTWATVL